MPCESSRRRLLRKNYSYLIASHRISKLIEYIHRSREIHYDILKNCEGVRPFDEITWNNLTPPSCQFLTPPDVAGNRVKWSPHLHKLQCCFREILFHKKNQFSCTWRLDKLRRGRLFHWRCRSAASRCCWSGCPSCSDTWHTYC